MIQKEMHRDFHEANGSLVVSRREFIKGLGVIASIPLLGTLFEGCITPKQEAKVATEMFQNVEGSLNLLFNTTRIDVTLKDKKGSGTGFFFQFPINEKQTIPIIITNKHVISEALIGKIYFHSMDDKGNPIIGDTIPIELKDFKDRWLYHPDESVDLCVMPMAPILNFASANGKKVFFRAFSPDLIPDISKLEDLTSIEDVIMMGYPIGLMDEKNNMPIIRRGITASHPALDYNNKPEFVIDTAAFPGSSGSPVLIYNQGSYAQKNGGIVIGTRVYLLGILYSGPQLTVEGAIVAKNISITQEPISLTSIPINLGNVIKSQKILDFEDKLKSI